MKQVVLRGGQSVVVKRAAPSPAPGRVLVATAASVISSGTERSVVGSGGGGGSVPGRAIRNPELIRRGLEHLREHGLRQTIEVARGTGDRDTPLGYSCAGTVVDTGGIARFRPGQRVACAGAGSANHAEVVSVPANLVVPVPEGVSLEDAAFATLGAIAMQGVRRGSPTLGEQFVVVGLGLLGLLTVQVLRAAGCRVLGVEPLEARRILAAEFGAERTVSPEDSGTAVKSWTQGVGADAVILTASDPSDRIVNDSISLLRRKGRLVAVGDVGLGLERPPLYAREADVLISTSYGPGRYDPTYEEQGIDYPIEYVRWTEGRNMEAFLQLLSTEEVRVGPLVELRLPVDRAAEAYEEVVGDRPPLAAVLAYEDRALEQRAVSRASPPVARKDKRTLSVALVGAGSFVRGTHLPNLRSSPDVAVKTVVTRTGTTAEEVAHLAGGAEASTDWRTAIDDPDIDLVIVGTRHDTHAEIASAALRAGKAVLVEKPLGLTREEIDAVWEAARENPRLAIGFNRPFAPLARRLSGEVSAADGPLQVLYRVSAPLPLEHWLNDPVEGGGRLLGEACHMYDFVNWLCGTPLRVTAAALPAPSTLVTAESTSVTIEYESGSIASVHYSGVGSPSMPKERIEVLGGGKGWVLDGFISLTSYSEGGEQVERERRPEKGHPELLTAILSATRGERPFEPGIEAAYAAQSVALAGLEALATGTAAEVTLPRG